MNETEQIVNTEEGPGRKITVHLSAKEHAENGYPNKSPKEQIDWIYKQIEEQLPDEELREAFVLARKERQERLENPPRGSEKFGLLDFHQLVEGSSKYAFRGITRRSDGKSTWQHADTTNEITDSNIHAHGIDAPGSEDMILPCFIWDMYAFPADQDIKNGINVSRILIYKNSPFVIPGDEGANETTLVDLSNKYGKLKRTEVSVKEAIEKGYPTLKDNYLGQIEVIFD